MSKEEKDKLVAAAYSNLRDEKSTLFTNLCKEVRNIQLKNMLKGSNHRENYEKLMDFMEDIILNINNTEKFNKLINDSKDDLFTPLVKIAKESSK